MPDLNKLQDYVDKGYVTKRKHPEADLYIYNYTQLAHNEEMWDEITMWCRGLILNGDGSIHSVPFKKFFNYEEVAKDDISKLWLAKVFKNPYHIQEKMDGSLGISYWLGDKPHLATRGSFESDQAIEGTRILHENWKGSMERMNKSFTYLFEIIYPDNKIVVDYEGESKLVHLSTMSNRSAMEFMHVDIGMPKAELMKVDRPLSQLHTAIQSSEYSNEEGIVITASNGHKIKMKHPEYVRLHRIMTGCDKKFIWNLIKEGDDVNSILENVPEEFEEFVNDTVEELTDNFNDIKDELSKVFRTFADRKQTAYYFLKQKHPHILFSMLDGKPVDHLIWKLIKPKQ